ncbi:MAG TPA: translocation/assembly module TamB domain-containing protein [Vicinamibacterales bacterium]|nr:translocation/assembly module TamB domain-containing protein [Vicinamibacterales bacterium]
MVRRWGFRSPRVSVPAQRPTEPQSRKRRVVRRLAMSGGVLCLLTALVLILLQSGPARRLALGRLTTLLASHQIELQVDDFQYSLFRLSVDVRNLRVRPHGLTDLPAFATVGRAQFNLSLTDLLRGRYVLESGDVRDIDINYIVDANGRDNLPRLPSDPNAPTNPVDFLIKNLSIPGARIRYANQARQVDVAVVLSNIDIAGNAITRRHQIRFESKGGKLQLRDHRDAIDHIAAVLDCGDDDLRIDRFQVDALGSRAEVAGMVRNLAAPELGLTLHTTVDAARAAALLDMRDPIGGSIVVDATATGPLTAPVIEGRAAGSGLQFRSLAAARADVRAAYDAKARHATISSAHIDAPWARVSADGELALGDRRRSRLRAELAGIDVAAIMHGLNLSRVVHTRIDGKLNAEWPGIDYPAATGSATLSAIPTASPARGIPIGGKFSARGDGAAIVADLQDIAAAGVEMRGRIQVDKSRHLQGQLQVSARELSATTRAVETWLRRPRGSLLPAPVSGGAFADVHLDGSLDNPVAHTTITAPSLSAGTATGVGIGADVTVTRDTLTIARGDANWNGAHAGLSGAVNLTGNQRLNLVLEGDVKDLQRLVDTTLNKVPVSGVVKARGTIRGTLARPLARITLRGDDIIALGEQFGSLDAEATFVGRDATLTRLVVDKPQPEMAGRITATGSYNLDRTSYTFDLQSENLRLLTLTLPGGPRVRGNVQLEAKGTGTSTAPAGSANLIVDSIELDGLQRSTDATDAPPALQLGRIVITANAANRQAEVTASAERFNTDVKAQVAITRPWPTTVTLRANDLDLEKLPLGLEAPLIGTLRASIDASGDLAEPAGAHATATVETNSAQWNGQPFSVVTVRELRYQNERLTIDRLNLTARESSLAVKGELPLTAAAGTGNVDIEAHANLATLARFLPPDMNVTTAGAATLTGSIAGTLKSIVPDLVLTVENGLVSSPQLGPGASNIQLRAHLVGGAAEIERLSSQWGSATIEAAGTIPLEAVPPLPVEIPRRGGPTTIKASVRDLDPSTIPGMPAGVTGHVSVNLDASAARADLAAVEGRLEFPQLELALKRLTLSQQEPSQITISSGQAAVQRLALTGTAGNVTASGTVGLAGERRVDARVEGALKIAALSVLSEKVRTDGLASWKLAAHGSIAAPELDGTFDLTDATIASDDLGVAAVDINAHVDLAGTRMQLTKLGGEVNGGALEGAGSVTLANGTIRDVDLQFSAKDFAYDAPLDLRSLSSSTIRVNRRGDEFLVAGQIAINEAGLTTDINFDEGLFAAITAPRTLDLTEARNPILEHVRFAVDVDTDSPVMIDNNLARAEIDADLRIVGTPYEPGLTGRLTLAEGGQITLNARRYEVERGIITFVDDRRIVPSVDLVLNTKASNYDVRIAVAGTPGKTETNWTSDPPLPEPDIMALVVTGRTVDEMRGEESEVARIQALSYLTGRVGSKFGRGLERATGISEVRIEPVLIANETDPTARLTVGQNVTDQVKLIYSTNLADSDDQIWVAEYDVTRRFQMRGVREREDDSYRVDFRHDVRFGGAPAPRREIRRRPTITSLTVSADGPFDEASLRKLFKLKEGDTYEFFATRSGLERIEKLYIESGYLQSRVRLERQVDNDQANLTLRVTSGPIVDVRFEGTTPPLKIQQKVRTAWHHGVFDRQRGNDSVRALREWLMLDKYLQPHIEYELEESGQQRRLVFRMQPGPRYESVVLVFEGASGVGPDRLNKIIEQQRLERQVFTDPPQVTGLLQRYYHEQGYLSAEIDTPRFEFEAATARVVVPVREGPRFQIAQITASGNTVYTTNDIVAKLPIAAGGPFISAGAEHSLERIRDLYWSKGYNDMHSEYALVLDRSAGRVDVAFTIVEGRQNVVANIDVEGNRRTSENLVRGQVELTPSQPLDLAVLARSRRNLYSTGAYSIADITRVDAGGDTTIVSGGAQDSQDSQKSQTDSQKAVNLNVSVREVQPLQLRYGLSYDTEGGLGGILDFSVHNVLRRARVFGAQGRYDSEIHEARLYVSQPSLRSWPRKTTASVYFRQDLNPPTEQTDPFDISRQGASIQQEAQFRKVYVWSYGYRYELATTLEPSLGVGATETVRVTPLSSTLTRETRDEVLDASKGTFLSQAFAYSPSWLGSDRPYLKYYGQYFRYFPLRPGKPKPFTNEIIRPRLVYATGARIGLANGIGGDVPTSERFYAGGSTTMRGFEQNAVGPIGVNNIPAGGNAVFILNNELRMPVIRIIDGVVFLDVGNVYPTIKDFSFTDLRESAGVGLRLRTPWVLLRTDYGFVLDPRPGERRSRFYFSIGQAF